MDRPGDIGGPGPITHSNHEENEALQDLQRRLQSMRSCYELMRKHGSDLQTALTDFELSLDSSNGLILNRSSAISEKSTLFGIAANAMMNTCDDYLSSAESEAQKVVKLLQFEKQRTHNLEHMVHRVAKEHTFLERKTTRFSQLLSYPERSTSSVLNLSDDEDQLSDVESNGQDSEDFMISERDSLSLIRQSILDSSTLLKLRNTRFSDEFQTIAPIDINRKKQGSITSRRKRVPDRPNIPFSAWSILKNSIGKDLSKIPMPVNFNEPISLLQRLTEDFEYSELLDFAAKIDDKCEQLAYVAAYSISSYSSTANRTGKPFNPLLGETYEFDRTADLGWRSIAEQVSHHPPISVLYCEGNGWTLSQDYSMATKFRGKNLEVLPTGSTTCTFHKSGNAYTWGKVTTVVNNIIVGKMWLDQQGQVNIVGFNGAEGLSCQLTYVPYSIFSSETQRRVNGVVMDEDNTARLVIRGIWDFKVDIAEVLSTKYVRNEPTYKTDEFKLIWRKIEPDPENYKYHYFSAFTCELNELEDGTAPTDSRLRPDIRFMELGDWDNSNLEKLRLEEKQRKKRKHRSASDVDTEIPYEPIWFERVTDNDRVDYVYKGTYWNAKQNQDWSQCPDIF